MAAELKPSGLDFGAVIAFVAPGFVGFGAAAYHLPVASAWLAAAAQKDQGVGVFLFVLLASLALGLAVSGVRALLLDRLLDAPWLGKYAVPPLSLDWSRIDERNLVVLVTIRDNFYRYYQFYSNMLVALIIWVVARSYSTEPPLAVGLKILISGGLVVLFLSARQSLIRYVKGVNQLIPPRNPL